MAWQNPKTDWAVNPKNPVPEDFNRIEGNIDFLKQDIETKKGLIVDAINDMNQPAQVSDTHAQLASKIRDISKDATAAVGDVEKGKTFYAGGQKRTGTLELTGDATAADVLSGKTFYNTNLKSKVTGTMPNRGAVVITPSTQNQAIQQGYHNGQGYVKGDANLKAENIGKGRTIFGVNGTFEGYYTAGNDVLIETQSIEVGSDTYTKVSEIRVLFSGSIRYYFYVKRSGEIADTEYKAQIRINGVPVGTERQGVIDMVFTEDINVNQGDLVQLYMRIGQPSQATSYVRANPIRIMVDKAKKVDILL